jgi:hypothetical protein
MSKPAVILVLKEREDGSPSISITVTEIGNRHWADVPWVFASDESAKMCGSLLPEETRRRIYSEFVRLALKARDDDRITDPL